MVGQSQIAPVLIMLSMKNCIGFLLIGLIRLAQNSLIIRTKASALLNRYWHSSRKVFKKARMYLFPATRDNHEVRVLRCSILPKYYTPYQIRVLLKQRKRL